ncbi:uncharacterized protein LOC126750492 isoform X1 [Anthonomus grandis grandis]|uniref:uncharacterized protein LOC126750492 isoform X1 n=1 Tax=Anthonomus grandis grandis TaxID=2921223 RepID=UPI0021650CDA|nr:uncharacterized protein LOC126750492 isoform X1 [Anthonomus grandis grandis]XP_050316086.1 uncharacterized protein LOC126750492 isoform X1 [Anthonomus grandis grandis]
MSQCRFRFLLDHLRFDHLATRDERKQTDKLAAIRTVFDTVVGNFDSAYTPFEWGLKIFAMVDAKTFYTCNMEVYVGKQPEGPFQASNSPTAVVQRLWQSIKGNITVDNWFTSMELLNSLQSDFKLTLSGTVRKNKRELPPEFSNPLGRPLLSSMFAFRHNCTLVPYTPKKKKNVLLLSSMHFDDKIDASTGKPDMILDYNLSKGGVVDCVDKLCASYNCARNTRRWPLVVFYSLLNISGINSFVVHSMNNNESIRRRKFLRSLSFQLVEGYIRRRMTQTIPKATQLRIKELFGLETPTPEPLPAGQRGRCSYCDRKKNRPSRFFLC